jgi:hypothetical protein
MRMWCWAGMMVEIRGGARRRCNGFIERVVEV